MGPLSSYIHEIVVSTGYSYQVKPSVAGSELGSVFIIKGISSGVVSQIIANDEYNYLLLASYSKYEFELSEKFMLGMNCLNMNHPTGIKFYFNQNDSCISSVMQVLLSGSFPNAKLVNDALYHTINSLRDALERLNALKAGTWIPKCEFNG